MLPVVLTDGLATNQLRRSIQPNNRNNRHQFLIIKSPLRVREEVHDRDNQTVQRDQ